MLKALRTDGMQAKLAHLEYKGGAGHGGHGRVQLLQPGTPFIPSWTCSLITGPMRLLPCCHWFRGILKPGLEWSRELRVFLLFQHNATKNLLQQLQLLHTLVDAAVKLLVHSCFTKFPLFSPILSGRQHLGDGEGTTSSSSSS